MFLGCSSRPRPRPRCSLFSPTPSLCSMVSHKFSMRSDARTYNLSGMGCSAGIISIDLAKVRQARFAGRSPHRGVEGRGLRWAVPAFSKRGWHPPVFLCSLSALMVIMFGIGVESWRVAGVLPRDGTSTYLGFDGFATIRELGTKLMILCQGSLLEP